MLKRISSTLLFGISIMFLLSACSSESAQELIPEDINLNEKIPVYNFDELERLLYTDSDKTYIINFWAMWCLPCVKEMPFIQQYADKHPNVEVILVSLDFPEDIEAKLKPFLEKKKIKSKVVILDDPNSNEWINKIDPKWSGSIPFTIVFNKDKRMCYERSFESLKDLENEINLTFNK